MGLFKQFLRKFSPKNEEKINEEVDIELIAQRLNQLTAKEERLREGLKRKQNAVKDLESLKDMDEDDSGQFSRAIHSMGNAKVEKEMVKSELNAIHLERVPESFYGDFQSELKDLKKADDKQRLCKSDMHHLEGEKGYLEYQKEKYEKLLKIVRYIGVTMSLIIGIAILGLAVLYTTKGGEMIIPVVVLFAITLFTLVWVYIWKRHINHTLQMNAKKQERATELLNKVKLRYARHTNLLSFAYKKYNVHSVKELSNLWEDFNQFKHTNAQYQELRSYETSVMNTLDHVFEKYNIMEDDFLLENGHQIMDKQGRKAFMNDLAKEIKEDKQLLKNSKKELDNYWKVIYELKSKDQDLAVKIHNLIESHIQ